MTVAPTDRGGRPIDTWLADHAESLVAVRRDLHANPELSGQEFVTTRIVAERLDLAGLSPRWLGSGTGLICDLAGPSTAGPILALRADLDALGMHDEKDVPYRSRVPGVSHACGHDVHTTVMLGVALYFAHHLDQVPGRLRFIFQPAEERVPGGALDVIADGGLHDIGAIIGVHCEPKLDVGTIALKSGPISSAADMASITLRGPGGHTARPELTVDIVALAARVISELPERVAAEFDHPGQVKFVFGSVHAGDAANVIPTHCEMRASVRTPIVPVWEALPHVVERTLAHVLSESGAQFELDYVHGVPPVVNDHDLTEVVRRAASIEFGAENVALASQSWGGDDFAWFTRDVPGTYVRLGVHDPRLAGPRLDLHAGRFDVDERAIALGVRLVAAAVTQFFADGETSDDT